MIGNFNGFMIAEAHGHLVITDSKYEFGGFTGDPEMPAFARKAVGLGAPTVSEFMEKNP